MCWGHIVFLLNEVPTLPPQAVCYISLSQGIVTHTSTHLSFSFSPTPTVISLSLSFFSHYHVFFPWYHSISKTKSVLIGSRGLREASCQWWQGSWLVQRHSNQQTLVSVSGPFACSLVRWTHLVMGGDKARFTRVEQGVEEEGERKDICKKQGQQGWEEQDYKNYKP